MPFETVIMAGGVGARMAPYTLVLPKPLLPIGERPILDLILTKLAREGCSRATLCIGHLGPLIQSFCGDGSRWGLTVEYFTEREPLGTVGALGAMGPPCERPFIVMNGDVVTDLDIGKFLERHDASGAELTIAGVARRVKEELGVLEVDGDRLVGYREKPETEYIVSMGIYAFSSSALDVIPGEGAMDLPDLAQHLIATGRDVRVEVHDGFWLDLGRLDDFTRAAEDSGAIVSMMERDGPPAGRV